ncbi:hypothetical protein [Paraburkholderia aromaticivorans]|nr:hypothetical protein [Paraburkholderia aromaticivorans]
MTGWKLVTRFQRTDCISEADMPRESDVPAAAQAARSTFALRASHGNRLR